MKHRHAQRGDSNLGCILWLIVLAVGGMIVWKAVPVKMANAEMYDYMVEQAKFSGRLSAEELTKRLYRKSQELNLPVDRKQIRVEKTSERVRMRMNYEVPVEFPGYTHIWKVEHQVDRPIFYL